MTKKIILFIALIIFISIIPKNSFAYDSINFKNITIEDGLSQGTVEHIIQDSKGYMWLATNDGLNRYNGTEFKIFKHNMNDRQNTIQSNYITSLAEDDNGYLWIGTDKGISRMDLSDYSIKNYYTDESNLSYGILTIYKSKENKIYIGTHIGIFVYDEKKDNIVSLDETNEKLTDINIYSINEDNEGNLWIGTQKGLNKLNIKTNKVKEVVVDNTLTSTWGKIYCITFDNNNNVWVGTEGNGLKKIDLSNNKVECFYEQEGNSSKLQSNIIRTIVVDNSDDVWIGTEKGLSRYRGNNNFVTYSCSKYDNNTLGNNVIYHIYEDKRGLIWTGSFVGIGVFDGNNKIATFKSTEDKNSLSGDIIFGVYEDDEELLWIGTRDKNLNIIDRKNDKIIPINEYTEKHELISDSITFITGKDNIIWVGTREGLNKIDKKTKEVKKYTVKDGLVEDNIKTLLLDSEDNLWIGTPTGLNILNTKTNEITDITQKLIDEGMENPYIQELFEDSQGTIFIGGYATRGLILYDIKNNTMESFKFYKNENTGENIELDTIRHIIEDKNNVYWIATSSGLLKFNKEEKTFKVYTEDDGLANNVVYQILMDDDKNLWMSTNNGISMLDTKKETFKNLTIVDGLQGNEFNGNSAYKCKNGDLVFGGVNGLNIFNPTQILQQSCSGKVNFDSFDVMAETYIDIDNKVFNYNENFIRIKFFLDDYKNTEHIQYFYKLEGVDDNWVSVKNNEAIFSNLKPGTYKFRVKAKNSCGQMSEENTTSFTIKPPFWKSKLSFLLYGIIIILIIYRQITKVKRLDALVNKKTEQLNEEMAKNKSLYEQMIDSEKRKNSYFINLSHELRTPLNVLNSIEQLIRSFSKSHKTISNEKLDEYMDIMKNNTNRLMNLINNIMDTSKIEDGKYIINKEPCDIVYLVEEATLTLKETIEADNIELVIDTDVEEKIINCDPNDIERCIINLVSNAKKFTPSGGKISVNIEDLGKNVKITVEDTGIGIDKKYHKHIFDRFNQVVDDGGQCKKGSGLGLTITKQIINLHGGDIYIESEINKGSKFIIILPV